MTRDAMNQEQDKDSALAAYTDALLAGELDSMSDQSAAESSEPKLAETVGLLARNMAGTPPPESLRRQTRHWVTSNWGKEEGLLAARLKWLLRVLRARPAVTLGTLSALGLVVVLLAILLPSGVGLTSGTVVGDTRWVALALVMVGIVGAAVWIAIRNRRN